MIAWQSCLVSMVQLPVLQTGRHHSQQSHSITSTSSSSHLGASRVPFNADDTPELEVATAAAGSGSGVAEGSGPGGPGSPDTPGSPDSTSDEVPLSANMNRRACIQDLIKLINRLETGLTSNYVQLQQFQNYGSSHTHDGMACMTGDQPRLLARLAASRRLPACLQLLLLRGSTGPGRQAAATDRRNFKWNAGLGDESEVVHWPRLTNCLPVIREQ